MPAPDRGLAGSHGFAVVGKSVSKGDKENKIGTPCDKIKTYMHFEFVMKIFEII